MDALARYLFKPAEQVTQELSALSEQDRVETVRRMLLFSRSTYEMAKQVMPSLGLDDRMDLLALACRSDPKFDSHVSVRKVAATFNNRGHPLTPEIVQALKDMNVPRESWGAFMRGEPVTWSLPTRSGQDTHGFMVLKEDRLASGILIVHDPGDGLHAFADFRGRSTALAVALGKDQIELVGGSISNQRLGRILVRKGFELSTIDVPAAFGGGEMEILSKCFPVRAP